MLRGACEVVLGSWLAVMIPTVAVYLATSTMDAAAALSIGSAMRTGTALWSLGLGGAYGAPSAPAGQIALPMLGLTLVYYFLARLAVRRAKPDGPLSALLLWLLALALTALFSLAAAPAGSRCWPAIGGMAALLALVLAQWLQVHGRGWAALASWWQRRPAWLSPALILTRDLCLALTLAGTVVVGLAAWDGAARITRLHDTLATGGLIASAGLVIIQLLWLPNVMIWAISWLAGPGFVVGQGTVFAPDHVVAGAVPTLPLLGMLPTAPLGGDGSTLAMYLPLVLTALAMVVAALRWRRLAALSLAQSATAALTAALALTGITGLACVAASGSIGPGRLTSVGPHTLMTMALIALEMGAGVLAIAILAHPATRRLTERGVQGTADATRSAAGAARDHYRAGREAFEARREERAAAPDEASESSASPEDADSPSLSSAQSAGSAASANSHPSAASAPSPASAASPHASAATGMRGRPKPPRLRSKAPRATLPFSEAPAGLPAAIPPAGGPGPASPNPAGGAAESSEARSGVFHDSTTRHALPEGGDDAALAALAKDPDMTTEALPTQIEEFDAARLVVLVSGTGSNLKALLEACEDPAYGARVVAVVADKECAGLAYAREADVPVRVVLPADFASRPEWDAALADHVAAFVPDLVVCAGFMRILGQPFLERFEGRILNTHPSLLPKYPGAHAVRDALADGATTSGATLFWVDAGVDTGAIIVQVEVPVEEGDTEESLTDRVKAAETPQLIEQVGILARSGATGPRR